MCPSLGPLSSGIRPTIQWICLHLLSRDLDSLPDKKIPYINRGGDLKFMYGTSSLTQNKRWTKVGFVLRSKNPKSVRITMLRSSR